jgi:predicted DNA binding protein
MTVILEFTLAWDEFALGRALSSASDRQVQLERIIPAENTVIPFFWVVGERPEQLKADVDASEYVQNLSVVDQIGDHTLYRVEWTGEYEDLLNGIVATGGTILEGEGSEEWYFQLRFLDHEHVADFYNFCTERDIPIHIERTYTLTEESLRGRNFGLTPKQREALLVALERGYFATPQETDMSEMAEELGITQQAFSDRLRRAERKVLENVLTSSTSGGTR